MIPLIYPDHYYFTPMVKHGRKEIAFVPIQ